MQLDIGFASIAKSGMLEQSETKNARSHTATTLGWSCLK